MFKTKDSIFPSNTHNSIGAGTIIRGELIVEEDIRIDGKIEGNIDCKGKVVIGAHAKIIGNIRCVDADLMGTIQGDMDVEDTLSLRASVVFQGKVITKNLEIEPGATFNGSCEMRS